MQIFFRPLLASLLLVISMPLLCAPVIAQDVVSPEDFEAQQQGKMLAFDTSKGNCLACHAIEDGEEAGNLGPILIAMEARFPDKAELFDIIWDARLVNPNTIMPPYGTNGILTQEQIDKIVEYLHSL